jgi:TPR repeat protein
VAVWLPVSSFTLAQTATSSTSRADSVVSNEAVTSSAASQTRTNTTLRVYFEDVPDVAPVVVPQTNAVAGLGKLKALWDLPFDELKKKAQAGDADAQYALGYFYFNGWDVSPDYVEAVKWFRKATEQGHDKAQSCLGLCYYWGKGVPRDYSEAVKWLRRPAEQGEPAAQGLLASCYLNGLGVSKDAVEAVRWFRRAAEQGLVIGQLFLGRCYLNGWGVSQDYVEAVKWFRKAAEQGDAEAQLFLGKCYLNGWGVSQDYVEAVKWFRKAAEQGDATAQSILGWCYSIGRGVPQDYVEAYKWDNLAAAQSETNAARARDNVLAQLMTPEQIAEGQRRTSRFVARHEKAAAVDQGNPPDAGITPKGSGTGFFIAGSYLLTSYHVVKDARTIKVVWGKVREANDARLVKADPANDLALLNLDNPFADIRPLPDLPIVSSRDVRLGDSVFTLGFPNIDVQGVEPKLTRGEINSLSGVQDDLRFFQISAPVQPGNSGGPLVDLRGNVIGIVEARLDDLVALETSGALPQNVNYALKSSFLIAFLDSVPELLGKLKEPHAEKDRPFDDVVKEVQKATVMVIVY